jgi:UDP-2-acetamido-2,6-beta-L-arabino-hexul-4-ose reductase
MEYKKELKIHSDDRGGLVEAFKFPEGTNGQVFYSTSKSGVVRGNHYHTRKIERFVVIEGEAKIRQRNRETGEIIEDIVTGDAPEVVEMKLGWTHNIENIGNNEMKLLVWANEVFDPEDPDTFAEEV